ncbi:MAG: endopeptidase La [Moraxellaceae bacterium]|jgi:ATP-dependent Lon protease|nr:endopeptidase La [Moraxellaceae bacterium]
MYDENQLLDLPLLPLRDVVIYPHMVIPLFVGRQKSIHALEAAMAANKQIFLVAQRDAADDDPQQDGLYSSGTVSTILQLLKLPDGTVKVLVEGNFRANVDSVADTGRYLVATVHEVEAVRLKPSEAEVLTRSLLGQFDQYVKLSKKVAPEVLTSVSSIEEPSRLADTIASHLSLKLEEKQELLEANDIHARIEQLMGFMESEIDILKVEKRIRGRVKKQMEKSQREYYLNEQMKAIQKELGDISGEGENEVAEIEARVKKAGMPLDARKKVEAELKKLKMMSPMSAEATVVRGYIDWMLGVPWKKRSRVGIDLRQARDILDADHYGLEEVKERILEYLAVQSRVKKLQGPVLCLVGPPGVGKTSLGQSIAKATNREFVRMALGGVRDEAEIRGHRRTYIGSMPGKLIQKLSKVGVKNPLFLLDEIDKMGVDMRGDPSSALLEVLDPEQNSTFNDHYLEVDYDLSEVMFICTANSMNIPAPLLDRMEVIRLPGYTEDEKVNIARQYLVPRQIDNSGLKQSELEVTEDAIRDLIRYYTREAGVRSLEREIAKICRKVVKQAVMGALKDGALVTAENLADYSGVRKFNFGKAEEKDQIGQVTGLAWTQVGGELLTIEAASVPGKGRHTMTGSLGDVMQESIKAAMTVVRSRSRLLGVPLEFHESHDIHIHMPEGATPKDGPSAGIALCTAIVSVLTGIPVRADVAMTGEITLRGQVLPIGGLKEKLLAAHRGGIKTVIIPEENERDLKEIPENIKQDLSIRTVKWIDEVLAIALTRLPEPLPEGAPGSALATPVKKDDEEGEDRPSTH